MCNGNHELRHNIPCHMENVSCGHTCDKSLPNCSHKCIKICHKGFLKFYLFIINKNKNN
jgi:transcriptional repressor NF-X1